MEYNIYDKFEYKVVIVSNNEKDIEKTLNNLGKQGWELISIDTSIKYNKMEWDSRLILKRKLIDNNDNNDIINEYFIT